MEIKKLEISIVSLDESISPISLSPIPYTLLIISALLSLLITSPSFAKTGNQFIDSVETALKNATADSTRLQLLFDLGWYIRGTNPKLSRKYCDDATALAIKLHDDIGLSRILNLYGTLYRINGKYDSSIIYHDSSIKVAKIAGYKKGIAGALCNISNVYGEIGNTLKSQENLLRASAIFEEIDDKAGLGATYMNIGIIFYIQKNNVKALEYYEKATPLFEELNDFYSMGLNAYNIGSIYAENKDMKKASGFFLKSLEFYKKANYLKGIGNCYENIGVLRYFAKEYKEAEEYFYRSIEIYSQLDHKEGIVTANNYLGEITFAQNEFLRAKNFFLNALELSEQIGSYYLGADIFHNLARVMAKLGDFQAAYEYQQKFTLLKDSVLNIESSKQVNEMQTKYETDKKEKENELLRKDQELKQGEINRQKLIILFVATGLASILILAFFIYRGLLQKKKANLELRRKNSTIILQKDEIEKQKKIIEDKNMNITDSITYAKRIQQAILPSKTLLQKYFPKSFLLYKPKDIICGDFYFFAPVSDFFLFSVVDCTGHGVPGALLSMIGNDLLHEIATDKNVTTSARVLDELDAKLEQALNPDALDTGIKDGMDIAFCAYNPATRLLHYSGANRPIILIRNGELTEYEPDYQPIGESLKGKTRFTNNEIFLTIGDVVYLYSDGFQDQTGGPKNKKFLSRNFRNLLLEIHNEEMAEQEKILTNVFEEWKGTEEQMDDITVMGIRII